MSKRQPSVWRQHDCMNLRDLLFMITFAGAFSSLKALIMFVRLRFLPKLWAARKLDPDREAVLLNKSLRGRIDFAVSFIRHENSNRQLDE